MHACSGEGSALLYIHLWKRKFSRLLQGMGAICHFIPTNFVSSCYIWPHTLGYSISFKYDTQTTEDSLNNWSSSCCFYIGLIEAPFSMQLFVWSSHTHFAVCDATKIIFHTFHWYSSHIRMSPDLPLAFACKGLARKTTHTYMVIRPLFLLASRLKDLQCETVLYTLGSSI